MSDTSRLYDLADQLYHLSPWAWMTEDQVIGIRHPETGELAYFPQTVGQGRYPPRLHPRFHHHHLLTA